jgi:hypothetical protein
MGGRIAPLCLSVNSYAIQIVQNAHIPDGRVKERAMDANELAGNPGAQGSVHFSADVEATATFYDVVADPMVFDDPAEAQTPVGKARGQGQSAARWACGLVTMRWPWPE